MVTEYARQQFVQAAAFFPRELKSTLCSLPLSVQSAVEEVRLRVGRPMTVVTAEGELSTGLVVRTEDLNLTIEIASQCSAYAVWDQVKNGYVAVRGGHRLGICGTGVVKNGEVSNLRQISSLSLRVAREFPGAASSVLKQLQEDGEMRLGPLFLIGSKSPSARGHSRLMTLKSASSK